MGNLKVAALAIFMVLFGLIVAVMSPHNMIPESLQVSFGIMLMLGGCGMFYIACNFPYPDNPKKGWSRKLHENLKNLANMSAMHSAAFDLCGGLLILIGLLGAIINLFQGYDPWFLVLIPVGGYSMLIPRLWLLFLPEFRFAVQVEKTQKWALRGLFGCFHESCLNYSDFFL